MSGETIIVRTDKPRPDTKKQELLTALIEEHNLPKDKWTRGSLEHWAFGRYAQSIFGDFTASYLVPRLQHPGRQDPSLLPNAHKVISTPLQTHHVLGDADRTDWMPADHALRFCFALVHGPERDVHNPLIDLGPSKRARNDMADLYRAGGTDAELRKLGKDHPPPSEDALLAAAMRVLEAFVMEWKESSREYEAFLKLPPRESPLSPVSSELSDSVSCQSFGRARVGRLRRSDADSAALEQMISETGSRKRCRAL